MAANKLPKLVRKDFLAWLEKSRRTSFVREDACPLECYLWAQSKQNKDIFVNDTNYGSYEVDAKLPKWAQSFTIKFDAIASPDMTKAAVLDCLK